MTATEDIRPLRHPGPVNAVAFSRNCQWIATACGGPGSTGLAQVFNVSSGSQVKELPHEDWVNWVAFSPDGSGWQQPATTGPPASSTWKHGMSTTASPMAGKWATSPSVQTGNG